MKKQELGHTYVTVDNRGNLMLVWYGDGLDRLLADWGELTFTEWLCTLFKRPHLFRTLLGDAIAYDYEDRIGYEPV